MGNISTLKEQIVQYNLDLVSEFFEDATRLMGSAVKLHKPQDKASAEILLNVLKNSNEFIAFKANYGNNAYQALLDGVLRCFKASYDSNEKISSDRTFEVTAETMRAVTTHHFSTSSARRTELLTKYPQVVNLMTQYEVLPTQKEAQNLTDELQDDDSDVNLSTIQKASIQKHYRDDIDIFIIASVQRITDTFEDLKKEKQLFGVVRSHIQSFMTEYRDDLGEEFRNSVDTLTQFNVIQEGLAILEGRDTYDVVQKDSGLITENTRILIVANEVKTVSQMTPTERIALFQEHIKQNHEILSQDLRPIGQRALNAIMDIVNEVCETLFAVKPFAQVKYSVGKNLGHWKLPKKEDDQEVSVPATRVGLVA